MQLFVLVSTGQKVANLPPVLEVAQPGDRMLWIESNDAQQRNWTDRPMQVLRDAGLETERIISVSQLNDPYIMKSTLEPVVDSLKNRFTSVYLVTNGGTKHTPIGLLAAFQNLSPKLLYGDERPAVYSIYPFGFMAPPEVEPYTRHQLDLSDILRVNGYVLSTASEHRLIWPDPGVQEVVEERYGKDGSYTNQLHRDHFRWASVSSKADRVPFEEIGTLVPDAYERWLRTFKQLSYSLHPQNLSNIYNGTPNLADSAREAAARRASGVVAPTARIGDALERAVARRVRGWQMKQRHPAIQSIWMGAKIARETTPHIVEAEFDILVVLKNGILVHLECKSANVETRQVDANTHRLRQAASALARSVVVIPIFAAHSHEPWFGSLHRSRKALEEQFGAQNVLLFTLPGQPEEYEVVVEGIIEREKCPSFEQGLEALLRPYHP